MKNIEFNNILKEIINKYSNAHNLEFWANLINIDKSNLSRYINGYSKSMDVTKIETIEAFLNTKKDSIKNYLIDENSKHLFHGSREGIKGKISEGLSMITPPVPFQSWLRKFFLEMPVFPSGIRFPPEVSDFLSTVSARRCFSFLICCCFQRSCH